MHNLCKRKKFNNFFCMNRHFLAVPAIEFGFCVRQNIEKLLKSCLLAKLKLCGIIGAEAWQPKEVA